MTRVGVEANLKLDPSKKRLIDQYSYFGGQFRQRGYIPSVRVREVWLNGDETWNLQIEVRLVRNHGPDRLRNEGWSLWIEAGVGCSHEKQSCCEFRRSYWGALQGFQEEGIDKTVSAWVCGSWRTTLAQTTGGDLR